MQKYFKGDLKGSESSLNQTLRTNLSTKDKAQAYKYLGIVQYMQGKRDQATSSFKMSLRFNPNMKISSQEALDDSVIAFFNSVKRSSSSSSMAKPSANVSSPANNMVSSKVSVNNKKMKATSLKVISNIPSASVMINGILAGEVNTILEVRPGKIVFEVSAPGYVTRKISTNIIKDRENSITVNLSKPKPKVVKQAPIVNQAPKSVKSLESSMFDTKEYTPNKTPSSSSGYTGNTGNQQGYGVQIPSNPYQQYAPSYQYIPPQYQQQPMYQYPQQPMYQYPQQPMYQYQQQPMYQQQPQSQQSVPSGNDYLDYENDTKTSSASVLKAPPAPPAASDYAQESYTDYNSDSDSSKAKQAKRKKESVSYYFDDPSKKSKSSYKSSVDNSWSSSYNKGVKSGSTKRSKSTSTILKILPFGIAQFYQKRILVGSIVASVQVAGLGYGIYKFMQYKDCETSCQQKINDELEKNPNASDTEKKALLKEMQDYQASAQTGTYIGIGIFFAGWGAGVIDAFINEPKGKSSKRYSHIIEKNMGVLLADEDANTDISEASNESIILKDIQEESKNIDGIYSYLNNPFSYYYDNKTSINLMSLNDSYGINVFEYKYEF